MSSLVSQENKELLWSLLAEEGLFDGIPENVTPEEIKHVFERILKNLLGNHSIPSRCQVERITPSKAYRNRGGGL